MAKTNRISKRMNITLSPSSHKILTEYKEETGQGISSLIDEIVTSCTPMLKDLIKAHKAIKNGKLDGIQYVQESIHRASEELSQVAIDFDQEVESKIGKRSR